MCEEMCNDKNDEKANERVYEFVKEVRDRGLGCGDKIADIAKKIHPDALVIVPLYRSCIVIEQSDEEKKDGVCTLHSYADPHWLGGDIDVENLKSERFHYEFCVQGDRQGPVILKKHCGKNVDIAYIGGQHSEDEYPRVLEQDEN